MIRAAGGVGINTNNTGGASLAVQGDTILNGNVNMGGALNANMPLEFKINGQRGLRMESGGSNSVNVIGGWAGNSVAPGIVGATVSGGGSGKYVGITYSNRVEADFGSIGGGAGNLIDNYASSSTVGGGYVNLIDNYANSSTIGGGSANRIGISAFSSTIGGGAGNGIGANASESTIGGGAGNSIQPSTYSMESTIGGGFYNNIQADSVHSTISGGWHNNIGTNSANNTIGGGYQNDIGANSPNATIGGGYQNIIGTNSPNTSIGGGYQNKILANSEYANIPGGQFNEATNYAFAAGRNSKAWNTGAFVWADVSSGNTVNSASDNSVTMRAAGGYRLFSNPSASSGVSLAPGGTAWAVISDRNAKKDFAPINAVGILEKLAALPVTQWHYNWETAETTPHIGPMAQDFKAAFYPGTDDKSITTLEADGVAFAAIQGLNQKLEAQRAENAELKQQLAELKALVQALAEKR